MKLIYRILVLLSIIGPLGACERSSPLPKGDNEYQRLTGDLAEEGRSRWDAVFSTERYIYGKEPEPFLKRVVDQLPVGRALDLAMSEGRNAVFLAKKGFKVEGVDISEVALRKARWLAKENNVSIGTINADLTTYQIEPETYDVILNILYLQRSLIPQIKAGLKKGGMVVFVNQTTDQLKNSNAKNVPREWLLEKGELRKSFQDFEILIYEETNDGTNALASLLARKR